MRARVLVSPKGRPRRRHRTLAVGVLIAVVVAMAPAAPGSSAGAEPAHPRLLFGANEVDGLHERVESGVPAQAWEKLRFKADYYLVWVQPARAEGFMGQNQMPTYLTDLSMAYVLSGDERYGRRAIDLVLALADAGWPAWNGNELGRGDLSRGLALAFDWTHDLMSDEERGTIVSSLVEHLPPLESNKVHENVLFSCLDPDWWGHHGLNNWMGVCGGGAGLLLLAIEGEDGTDDFTPWITRAKERTLQHIAGHPFPSRTIYGSGGDGAEGVNYALYGLKNALPFAFALERLKGEDILALNPGLSNVPLWMSFEQLAGQGSRFVPRNDAVTPNLWIHELGPMFFELHSDDGVAGWLWDQTAGPEGDDIFSTPYPPVTNLYVDPVEHPDEQWAHIISLYAPEVFTILYHRSPDERPRTDPAEVSPLSRLSPERGLVNFRTGFGGGPDDVVATYEARRNANGHVQSDLGHFSIYGYGARFALDSAYPGGDGTNAMAAGHNVVIVDGQRTTQWPGASRLNFDTIPFYADSPNLTFVRTDLRPAYAWPPRNPLDIPWADRDVLLSRTPGEPVLVAVSDNLKRSAGLHEYAWQLHTDGTHAFTQTGASTFVSLAPSGAAMAGAVGEANGERAILANPWQKAVYSADSPIVHTLVTSRDPLFARRPQLDHLAILAVTPPGTEPATTATLPAEGGVALSAAWEGGEALVASAAHGSEGVAGPVTMTGSFGKVTVERGESVLDEGTLLEARGREYVTASAPSSVVVSGEEVVVSGPSGATYRVFAPQDIARVTVNDEPVDLVRGGDYISFPAPDFTVGVDPEVVEEKKNTDASLEVGVAPVFGFSEEVALSVTGLPEGFDATLAPASVEPGSSAALTLRSGPKVRPGDYPIEVVGHADGLERRASGTFVVLDDDVG